MKVYKIKDTKTGLYSPGGNYFCWEWEKDAKIFKTLESARNI